MNAAHFHLIINHIPIVGSFIGLLLIMYAHLINKDTSNLKAGLVILTFSCFCILPVYFSGLAAKETIEHFSNINKNTIEEHEELADLGLYITLFVGTLGVITFLSIKRKNNKANLLTTITMYSGVLLTALFILIGHTGGEIRHPEIEQNEQSSMDKLKLKLKLKVKSQN